MRSDWKFHSAILCVFGMVTLNQFGCFSLPLKRFPVTNIEWLFLVSYLSYSYISEIANGQAGGLYSFHDFKHLCLKSLSVYYDVYSFRCLLTLHTQSNHCVKKKSL